MQTPPYTDTQLKQAIAKMLPDKVEIYHRQCDEQFLWWKGTADWIRNTELLHLCWLVEEGLDNLEKSIYGDYLARAGNLTCADYENGFSSITITELAHATWQQRVIALTKVKGVEIVCNYTA